jgi:hypothetical protein
MRDRIALALAFVIFFLAFLDFIRLSNLHQALGSSIPIGLSDSIGHPAIVHEFEKRLGEHPQDRDLIYCAAVANDFGGNRRRAETLYRELTDDHRAASALQALQNGRSEPVMPSPEEISRAFTAGVPRLAFHLSNVTEEQDALPGSRLVWPDRLSIMRMTVVVGVMLILILTVVRPSISDVPPLETSRHRSLRILMTIVPGWYDVRCRSPLRGWVMLSLFSMVLVSGVMLRVAAPEKDAVDYAVKLISPFDPMPRGSFPLPPDVRAIDILRGAPDANVIWPIVIGGLVALLLLHAQRIRRIWTAPVGEGMADSPTSVLPLSISAD